MAKHDYMPRKNAEKVVWAGNFKTKIAGVATDLGISDPDVAAITDAANAIISSTNAIEAAITSKEAAVNAATLAIQNAEALIRTQVKRLKTAPAYTESIGEDLGVVGAENTLDPNTSQPEITLKKDVAGWRIDFNLKGFFDSVNVYRQLPTDTAMHFLATDTSTPYIDTTAVPLATHYRCVYVINDVEVGMPSNDVITY